MDWSQFLEDVRLPDVYRLRQTFSSPPAADVGAEIDGAFRDAAVADAVKPGMRVAVAVGSRGVANLAAVVKSVTDNLCALGAVPFIVPAMGSHGAATAQGQAAVLAGMGIDEERVGVPVVATLDTVDIGPSPSGCPVHFDAAAADADALVAINRIKPHTAFVGRVESGICKMLAIGLGNQRGAGALHALGMAAFPDLIPEIGAYVAQKQHLLFGVGLLENYLHRTVRVALLQPDHLVETEAVLLRQARDMMGRIPVSHLHVLVIREIGKDISGEGMDPNVVGRYVTSSAASQISIQKIVVLDLSPGTGRNANGIGLADITTRRVAEKTDYVPMYVNALTARYCDHVKMPLTLDNDLDAVRAAIKSLWGLARPEDLELAVIKNTLQLDEMLVSTAVMVQMRGRPGVEILEGPLQPAFDAGGRLDVVLPLEIRPPAR